MTAEALAVTAWLSGTIWADISSRIGLKYGSSCWITNLTPVFTSITTLSTASYLLNDWMPIYRSGTSIQYKPKHAQLNARVDGRFHQRRPLSSACSTTAGQIIMTSHRGHSSNTQLMCWGLWSCYMVLSAQQIRPFLNSAGKLSILCRIPNTSLCRTHVRCKLYCHT